MPEPRKALNASAPESRRGLLFGLGAYAFWGVVPIYFNAVAHVSPWAVVSHRIIWSAMFLALLVSLRGEWQPIFVAFRNARTGMFLLAGSVLIATNWLVFIYAVASHQVLQASLGYFVNPLFSIVLGMVFLQERLRPRQWVAVAIATIGVINLALKGSGFPWIALSLAGSFGLYGLVRKKINVNSLHGLLIESVFLVPLAALVLVLLPPVKHTNATFFLLSLSGLVTAVPLLMFGEALRSLKLSTMGFLQYVGPSIQFVVALVYFREALDLPRLTSFLLCWAAIVVYVMDSLLARKPQPIADRPE